MLLCVLSPTAAAGSIIIEDELISAEPTADAFAENPQNGGADLAAYQQPPAQSEYPGDAIQIVVTAGGDVTLGCTQKQSESEAGFTNVIKQNGYSWPFSALSEILSADDLTLVNFEGTLTESDDAHEKLYNFKGPADYVNILTAGSVDAVNLANNHFHDYGEQGKVDTKAALADAGIKYCAEGEPTVYETKGVKIGLIGNTFPYTNGQRDIKKSVAALREQGCRIIIASFHWGSEYEAKFTGEQRSIGRAAIDAGADVVIGHHPHVLQGVELYKGKYIIYSLGNLVFGGNVNPEDKDAFLARVTFTVPADIAEATPPPVFEMIPIRLTELAKGTDYRPVPAVGQEALRIRDRALRLSKEVNTIEIADIYNNITIEDE
jgi:poly-gamma-glutamate synthesis protein (capsule biosynthesis protein)